VRGAALSLGDYARLLDAAPNVAYAKIEAVPPPGITACVRSSGIGSK